MKTPDTINGKTPEEIKQFFCKLRLVASETDDLLSSCDASDLLDGLEVARDFMFEAADEIEQLESRLAQAERERDAAVNDLREKGFCCDCEYSDVPAEEEPCLLCRERSHTQPKNWEWRGVPENTKEDSNEHP